MRTQIHDTLKLVGKDGLENSPLTALYLYKEAQGKHPYNPARAVTHLLESAINDLAESDVTGAEILKRHFFLGELIQSIARQLSLAEGTVYNRQGSAITQLAQIIERSEAQAKADYFCTLEERLPAPSYEQLVGIEEYIGPLSDLLKDQDKPPWIVALVGIGGIGKTSLANYLVRSMIADGNVNAVAWVTAKAQALSPTGVKAVDTPSLTTGALLRDLLQQLMPNREVGSMNEDEMHHALCTYLQDRPHLIVIDNLETVQDVEALIDTIEGLANPTKFLLTTRESLHDQVNIHNVSITELANEATLTLIRQEAANRNLSHLLAASDSELAPLVETVGGNPLALRLVVGQTQVHPLNVILENLRSARGQKTESLYTYIYRQAWDALDEIARRTLLVMPLVAGNGAEQAYITKISKLEAGDVTDALEQLVRLSLVDSNGGLNERLYAIHSLTRTFLHEQVIRWS